MIFVVCGQMNTVFYPLPSIAGKVYYGNREEAEVIVFCIRVKGHQGVHEATLSWENEDDETET